MLGEATINLRQLRYFIAVADTGAISTAANKLHMAQPAIGMQIKQLEDELGTQLLSRHSRGVTLTTAGNLLYRHAHRILDSVEQAKHEIQQAQTRNPELLRLGVNPSLIGVLGSALLTEAQTLLPNVKVSLTEERSQVLLELLERKQLDVALTYNVEERPDLTRSAVLEEDLLYLTAAKAAKGRGPISFSKVLKSELAIGGERSLMRDIVEFEARRLSLDIRLAFEVHSLSSMIATVRRGVATTVMPYGLCMKEMRKGSVVGRRIISPTLTRTLYQVYHRAHLPVLDNPRVGSYILSLLKSYYSTILPYARWISDERAPEIAAKARS